MDDATTACEDLMYFERRLKEVISHMQPRASRWRALLLVVSLTTIVSSYYWLCDPDIRIVTFWESLTSHIVFSLSFPLTILLFLIFGIHRRVVAPSIIAGRCREALAPFSLSCDENGKLIVRPAARMNSP